MRTFISPLAFLLLFLGLCNLPWSSAVPICNRSEIGCPGLSARSESVPPTFNVRKRQGLTNAERLRKRLPLLPPTRIAARQYTTTEGPYTGPGPSPLPFQLPPTVVRAAE